MGKSKRDSGASHKNSRGKTKKEDKKDKKKTHKRAKSSQSSDSGDSDISDAELAVTAAIGASFGLLLAIAWGNWFFLCYKSKILCSVCCGIAV